MEALPINVEAERAVLGATLLEGDRMHALYPVLTIEDFGLESHKTTWSAMRAVYDAGRPVDRLTVGRQLQDTGKLDSVGSVSFLVSLDDGMPLNLNLDGYIPLLKEKTALRRMLAIAQHAINAILDSKTPPEEIRQAFLAGLDRVRIEQSRGMVSTTELIKEHGIDKLLQPLEETGIRLPWPDLNRLLCGIRPAQMIVIGAATSRGKTSAALQIATHATRQASVPLYWTLEMPPKMLFRRIINQMAGLDSSRNRKRSLTFEERERERDSVAWVADHPIYFESRARTVPEFCASARQLKAQGRLDMIVVDYLQLIRYGRAESRTREVGENSRSLKLAAMELNVPFIVLSQFRRPNDNRPPGLHDLKESGDIENDADVVLLMSSAELSGERDTEVRCHVAKHREGPAGMDVDLIFQPRSQTFVSKEA